MIIKIPKLNKNKLLIFLKSTFVFSALFLLLLATYSPATTLPYLHHDGVYFLFPHTIPHLWLLHPMHNSIYAMGRVSGAFLFSALCYLVDNPADLCKLRFISIINLSFAGYFCFLIMSKTRFTFLQAFLLSIIFLTLPPFQSLVAYSGNVVLSFPVLFSSLAFLFAYKTPDGLHINKFPPNANLMASISLLFYSYTIYQPGAGLYWALAGLMVLSQKNLNWPEIKNKILKFYLIGIAALLLYGIYLVFLKFQQLPDLVGDFYNPYKMNFDIATKLIWFFREPFYNTLNLWNIFPSFGYFYFFLAFAGGISLSSLLSNIKNNTFIKTFFSKVSFLLPTIALTSLPNLLSSQPAGFYRCYTGLALLVVFILSFCLKKWIKTLFPKFSQSLFLISLFLIAAYGIFSAHKTILHYRAIPSLLEYNYIKHTVERTDINNYKTLVFIRAEAHLEGFQKRYDEFLALTTDFPQDTTLLLVAIFKELPGMQYKDVLKFNILNTPYNKLNTHNLEEPYLIFDMQEVFREMRILKAQGLLSSPMKRSPFLKF